MVSGWSKSLIFADFLCILAIILTKFQHPPRHQDHFCTHSSVPNVAPHLFHRKGPKAVLYKQFWVSWEAENRDFRIFPQKPPLCDLHQILLFPASKPILRPILRREILPHKVRTRMRNKKADFKCSRLLFGPEKSDFHVLRKPLFLVILTPFD